MDMKNTYNDLAIILAWPDATIRGDERWMMFFRKLGLVKNLNFKVGHTGVILVDPNTNGLIYYDFGRYIAPRGLGRARSPFSDPRLRMRTKAVIRDTKNGSIANLLEIAQELDEMRDAMQGEGPLYFSVASGINFQLAKEYADSLVMGGSSPYGAFAKGNNNCSRFITRMLMLSSKRYHYFHGVNLPESIKSSPISNVVNVRKDRKILVYEEGGDVKTVKMNRVQSLFFLLRQLSDNLSRKRSAELPDDRIPGSVDPKPKPDQISSKAQWLGGVGEGAWYHIEQLDTATKFEVSRYTETGELEYTLPFFTTDDLDLEKPYTITWDSHMLYTTLIQDDQEIQLHPSLNYYEERGDRLESNLTYDDARVSGAEI